MVLHTKSLSALAHVEYVTMTIDSQHYCRHTLDCRRSQYLCIHNWHGETNVWQAWGGGGRGASLRLFFRFQSARSSRLSVANPSVAVDVRGGEEDDDSPYTF